MYLYEKNQKNQSILVLLPVISTRGGVVELKLGASV